MIIADRCFWVKVLFTLIVAVLIPRFSLAEEEGSFPPLPPIEAQNAHQDFGNEESVPEGIVPWDSEGYESHGPIYEFLPSLRNVLEAGRIGLDDQSLERAYESQLNSGIRDFRTFSLFLIRESGEAVQRKEAKEAVRLAKASIRFAPSLPHPHWALARAYSAENRLNIFRVLRENLAGHWIAKKNFRSLLLDISNLFMLLHVAFFLTVIAFAVIVLGKYFRILAHDIGSFFPPKVQRVMGYVWGGILVSFPIILGFGPGLVACFWFLVVSRYLTKREKQVVGVIFLVLVLLPWSFRTGASMILANQPGVVSDLYRANYEDWGPKTQERLEEWVRHHPDDISVLFTLGLVNKRQHEYERAEEYYTKVIAINPLEAKAIGNLGNIYLAKKLVKKAEATHKKAIETDGTVASFHYNLYRTYLELYKFLEAQQEEELVVARKIDPQLIEYQEKRFSHSNSNRVVIDEILPKKELWHKVFAESERREALGSSLWRIVLRGIPLKYGTFVFILVCLVISFLFLQSSQRRLTALCIKCGEPIKRFGGGGAGSLPDICSNCISVIVGDKKVSQQSKEKKMAQIREYEKRQDLIWKCLTFGIPGGGHLRLGCPWLAVAILFTFFCFVTKALLWNGLLSDPLWLSGGSGGFTIGAFIISFLGFYGLSVMSSYHQKMRRSGFSDAFRIIRQREREQEGNRTGRGGDR